VHQYWGDEITPEFPQLQLLEREEVYLSAFARQGRTKRIAAETLSVLDFWVEEHPPVAGTPLFHIELKSGPSAIDKMSEFQLDINDSDDIIGAANNTGLPVYVFHVQTAFEYDPPTRSSVVRGIWWTDIFALLEHKIAVRSRRGEDKDAGYYSPSAFRPIATFPQELRDRRYVELRRLLKKNPLLLSQSRR
jgi:hypothetical protein